MRARRRILTCVLTGLLLNTAIAVICWIVQPRIVLQEPHIISESNDKLLGRARYLAHSIEWFFEFVPSGFSDTAPRPQGLDQTAIADPNVIARDRNDFGLPFRALRFQAVSMGRYSQIDQANPNFNHTLRLWQRGLPTGLQSHRHQRFPTEPLPGLLLNTLIFAAAILLASEITAHLLTGARRRRAECPACGYPTTDLSICPECGTPVGPRTP